MLVALQMWLLHASLPCPYQCDLLPHLLRWGGPRNPRHIPLHTHPPRLPSRLQTWRNWDLTRMTMHELYTQASPCHSSHKEAWCLCVSVLVSRLHGPCPCDKRAQPARRPCGIATSDAALRAITHWRPCCRGANSAGCSDACRPPHARSPPLPAALQFGLDVQTIDFVGHAIALHQNDGYMMQPALPTVQKIKLYYESMMR